MRNNDFNAVWTKVDVSFDNSLLQALLRPKSDLKYCNIVVSALQ